MSLKSTYECPYFTVSVLKCKKILIHLDVRQGFNEYTDLQEMYDNWEASQSIISFCTLCSFVKAFTLYIWSTYISVSVIASKLAFADSKGVHLVPHWAGLKCSNNSCHSGRRWNFVPTSWEVVLFARVVHGITAKFEIPLSFRNSKKEGKLDEN